MVDELNIPAPCSRKNPALMIRGSTLYIYGGRLDEWKKGATWHNVAADLER
ncbi:uncharacterized protein PHALS_07641 [Plasmopara halstedii]|uniref:Uncharacterized protein n=1 Tax=Plasmopara halstedii TaxID=4781 RepID=A0A0P1B6X8_PLAHL|nr:uncharacterized protein PHALS_07641 [Plasmopara halstedii]CEG49905.1 hypothetical protein PHALS_07641 [Plasmopara halstedii]|eukprot:XP_024586274.1 hypothetical protein PHALS_07641 [Plasmopara halstedii]